MIASASLKRRVRYFFTKMISMIPRRDCLGLIEARGSSAGIFRSIRRFRGVIASASLKPTESVALAIHRADDSEA